MFYNHKALFIPIGENMQSASEVKTVEVTSNNIIPKKLELSDAKRELSNSIDPYSARNHWKIGKFVSTYLDKTKLSNTPELRDFLINLNWANETRIKSSTSRKYIAVKHQTLVSGSTIVDDLKGYTDKSGIYMHVDRKSAGITRVYLEWETRDV